MTEIKVPEEQHDRATSDGRVQLTAPGGKRSLWRKEANEWVVFLRNCILLGAGVVSITIAGHRYAVKPIRDDLQALESKIDRMTRTQWGTLATRLELERAMLNQGYTPIPDARLEEIHRRVFDESGTP